MPNPDVAKVYTGIVCRGSWALGTVCGKCARCKDTRPVTLPKAWVERHPAEAERAANRGWGVSAPTISAGETYRSEGVSMYVQHEADDRGDPTIEAWLFTLCEEDGVDGAGWLEIDVHEIVETKRSGTLAVYYRQWFNPEGERLWSRKRVIGNLASLRAVIRRRKMTLRAPVAGEAV